MREKDRYAWNTDSRERHMISLFYVCMCYVHLIEFLIITSDSYNLICTITMHI